MEPSQTVTRLSQLDAFFIAYQEQAKVPMLLSVEVELRGTIDVEGVREAVAALVAHWPMLGQRARAETLGLRWAGSVDVDSMITVARPGPGGELPTEQLAAWRNRSIDPFREPPLQVWICPAATEVRVGVRAHHAVADGQAFVVVVFALLEHLAQRAAGVATLPQSPAPEVETGLRRMWTQASIRRPQQALDLLAATGRVVRDSTRDTARLAVESLELGDVEVTDELVDGKELQRVEAHARRLGVSTPTLLAAAWVKAIARHNAREGSPLRASVSLEVPVSLRRRREKGSALGNLVSPLCPSTPGDRPLSTIAADLHHSLRRDLRRRAHVAIPLLTTMGRYLPWRLLRRMSANTAFSGYATSHVTWLDEHADAHARIAERSDGAMELRAVHVATPVCLHMGAALTGIRWTDALQLSITHRVTAVPSEAASQLLADVRAALQDTNTLRQIQ